MGRADPIIGAVMDGERQSEKYEFIVIGEACGQLCELVKGWKRTMRVCPRSKRWWKGEWKGLIRRARKCTKVRKKLHNENNEEQGRNVDAIH